MIAALHRVLARWARSSSLTLLVLWSPMLGEVACQPPAPARDPGTELGPVDWNSAEVSWRSYEEGLAEAERTGTPALLVFYTDWCPHCHNYSRAFHDADVVKLARQFVMIRVNRDEHPDLSERYAPDGQYVPRTFFLRPDGEVRMELRGGHPDYQHYLDEHDPGELLGLMRRALQK